MSAARAGQELMRLPIDSAPSGTPAIGFGIRANTNIYIGSNSDVDLVPLYLYEGKWLFAHGTSGGLHAYKNDTISLDLILRYRFNNLDPDDNELLAGLNKRNQTTDGGVSGNWFGRFGALKAEYLWDVQNNHNGNEFDLTYRYPFEWGKFSFSPFASLIWQDSNLVDYYYGVSAEESEATGIASYQPGAATNFAFGVSSSYSMTDQFFLYANLEFQAFDKSIRNSPITDNDFVAGIFAGGGYYFGDADGKRKGSVAQETTWSWRINYGYTGEHNILPDPAQGDLKRNKNVNTYIGGLTVGKLVQSGERVDFYAKLALFRHFEQGLQDDFWNYTAYMMAIGKGYLPWSDQLAFRWGFGFGVSAAEKISSIEQAKQSNDNTSHVLTYLEWTVDFPLERLIKSKLTRNCFTGVTVVHRSGLFGTSDILGEVAGGADWYTLHLECLR